LRERREDIPPLARHFLVRYSEENRRDAPELTSDILKPLMAYDWPGNVRELENYIERAVVLANGQELSPEALAPPGRGQRRLRPAGTRGDDLPTLIQQLVRIGIQSLPEGTLDKRIVGAVERELIEQVLNLHKGVQVKAAAHLGINRNTLHQKASKFSQQSGDGGNDAASA
jgi:DNA-binding NtrC family response regulator